MNGKNHRRLPISARVLALVFFCGLVVASSQAQQATADATFVAPVLSRQDVDVAPVPKPAPYDIGGIVAQAFKMKKPWRMVSPLAPAKDGDGRDNVSWDPDKPEKPKGIIVLGIQW